MEAAFGEDKSSNVSVVDEYEGGAEVIEVDDL